LAVDNSFPVSFFRRFYLLKRLIIQSKTFCDVIPRRVVGKYQHFGKSRSL